MFSLSLRALTIVVSVGVLNAALTPRSSLSPTLGGLDANITGEDRTFDFVVIGAGTAGIPIAYRLSEDPSVTVALIEAGQFYEYFNAPLSSTPFGDLFGVGTEASEVNSNVDWGFITAPFPGANNRDIHYARGKALGGSSARNFMIYQRPTKASLQMWADDVDDQSYNWENFLPYFQKSVDFTPPDLSVRAANATAGFNPEAFSSYGGPLQVSFPKYAQPFSSFMPGGFADIGVNSTEDFNSGSLMGAQYTPGTIDPNGSFRASSQETFLTAAAARTNLEVFDMTMAKKIIFDDQKNAIGVQVNATGFPLFTINATKEIILSAGALQSPQLLMVSGVGPQATLEALDIPVIHANENVGQNMWDHVLAAITYPISTDSAARIVNDAQYQADSLVEWQTNGTGPFSNMNSDFLAWENVPENMRQNFTSDVLKALEFFPSDWPEVEYLVAAGFLGDWSSPVTEQPSSGNWGSAATGVVAPLSRGNVTIVSADVNDLPIINPNWLDHPADQAVIVAGYKRMRQLFASETVQKVVTGAEFYPGSNVSTDDEILTQIKNSSMTIWHASVTCKMGKSNDTTAVVDPHASVIGVQNLRVVDASSFAILPPGHPQSVVYALAEKISDDIKSTWSLQ
ncbi:hypothetical protein D9757_013583 [Collybiopsis confluens]|uniref:Glucose-methanol-choline oxidoreductase N-terminal domain-containing protein n=1 Tax=Collybiopsis confluens TaxID=2823264 RepID=A0A8H5GKF2_9AGAR|nr:hypothetical protein D9757_013583 [Collybiopsis confluens]